MVLVITISDDSQHYPSAIGHCEGAKKEVCIQNSKWKIMNPAGYFAWDWSNTAGREDLAPSACGLEEQLFEQSTLFLKGYITP